MLFDLRGRGRRRTVRVIYLGLAILMGGGLVLFGIGGATSGGLFDALGLNGNGSSVSSNDVIGQRVKRLEKTVAANPNDAGAWGQLAKARFQQAGQNGFNAQQQQYTKSGIETLAKADVAWQRYIKLQKNPDPDIAQFMVAIYDVNALNKPDQGVVAAEFLTQDRPSAASFINLARFAYLADQTRKGDLAADQAVKRSPKSSQASIRNQFKQFKKQLTQQQLQEQLNKSGANVTTQPSDGSGAAKSGSSGGSGTSTGSAKK